MLGCPENLTTVADQEVNIGALAASASARKAELVRVFPQRGLKLTHSAPLRQWVVSLGEW